MNLEIRKKFDSLYENFKQSKLPCKLEIPVKIEIQKRWISLEDGEESVILGIGLYLCVIHLNMKEERYEIQVQKCPLRTSSFSLQLGYHTDALLFPLSVLFSTPFSS